MKFFEQVNTNPIGHLLVLFVIFSIAIFVRYVIVSYLYHYTFFSAFRNYFSSRFLHQKKLKKKQVRSELYWSFISGVIFSGFALLVYFLIQNGHSQIYQSFHAHSVWYFPVSIFLFLFIQDTYYYWIHRGMHHPKVYRYVHLVHHKSVHTSAFTAFSFHPLETVLQALFFPMIICVLPMHLYAFLSTLAIMTLSATINHAGVEIFPKNNLGEWLQKTIIGATHHDAHHTKFHYNYGLYFTFWDRWMKTEHEHHKNKKN